MNRNIGYQLVAESVMLREDGNNPPVQDAQGASPKVGKMRRAWDFTKNAAGAVGRFGKNWSGYNDFRAGNYGKGAAKLGTTLATTAAAGYGVHKLRQHAKAKKAAKAAEAQAQ